MTGVTPCNHAGNSSGEKVHFYTQFSIVLHFHTWIHLQDPRVSGTNTKMADNSQLTAQNLFNIKNWICIVTGGGTGLGLMTANTLAANGAKVYITGRRLEKLQAAETKDSASGGSITAIQLDVTDKQSILDFAQQLGEKETHVNLLVNNAGQSSVNYGEQWTPHGDPKEVSERMLSYQGFDEWTNIYKVNVASLYFVSIALLPLLCKARDNGYTEAGNIINISSISGLTKESQWGQFR